MRRLGNRVRLGALLASILGATLALIAPPPAGATGPLATVRQLAGTIPIPYDEPRDVVPIGGVLYVTDRNAIDRVDLATSNLSTPYGVRPLAGSADGTGTAARFNDLQGLVTDGTNLYVADAGNHTIRKIVIATGVVTTIAGSAGSAGSGDGVGSAARFNQPFGIALAGGDLWITDRGNQTIRRLTVATGSVTTVAGTAGMSGTGDGTGAAARFSNLRGITVEGSTMWIADADRARRLDMPTSAVTTVTVSYSCSTFYTSTLHGAVVIGGQVYVSALCDDGDGDEIGSLLRIDPASNAVTELTSTGVLAAAVGTDGTAIFLGGFDPHTSFKFLTGTDVATWTPVFTPDYAENGSVDGAAAGARFLDPRQMASDGGFLFVADGSSIRKVAISDGQTTTFATGLGSGSGGLALYGPYLYVGSQNTLYRVDRYTGASSTFATVGNQFNRITGIVEAGGQLYLVSSDCTIWHVDPTTAAVGVFAGFPTLCDHVDGTGANARFGRSGGRLPESLTSDGTKLWVADWDTIRTVHIATAQVTTLVQPFSLFHPHGIAEAGNDLYVANGEVLRVDKTTGAVTQLDVDDPSTPLSYTPSPLSSTYAWAGRGISVDRDGRRIFFGTQWGIAVAEDPVTALSIGDSTVVEANGGTGVAVFTARLARPMRNDVSVTYLTNDGTATSASGDYVGQSGLLTIPAGDTEARIKVTVNGDTTTEANEGFNVRLVNPQGGATLTRFLGQGTILNDDPPSGPSLAIGDVGVVEGDEGTSLAVFPVRLSGAQGAPVAVSFATANGTAAAASDYEARAGTLTIPAGVTSATIFVKVYGDTAAEANESFTLALSASTGPPISRSTGTGTLINDDG